MSKISYNISGKYHHLETQSLESQVRKVSVDLKQKSSSSCHVYGTSFDSKCYTRTKKEQEYLEEVWSVQHVPQKIECTSKPSEIIDRLLLLKKSEHESTLQSFESELADLHATVNADIDGIKNNLQNNINEIDCNIEFEKNVFCEMKCVDEDKYNSLSNAIDSMINDERILIDEYFNRIKSIECKRQATATELFKKYYNILRKILYLPHVDLQNLMERKIMEYNKTTLHNHKKYEELKLQLRLATDVAKKNFIAWIEEMRRDRYAVCRKNALNEFYDEYENFKSASSEYFETIEGKAALCRLKGRSTIITELVRQWDLSVPFSANRFDAQSEQLNATLESIDATVTGFIKSYRFYFSKYLGRLFKKLSKFSSIVESFESSEETEDEDLVRAEEIYGKSKDEIDNFALEAESFWSGILKNLSEKFQQILKPFVDFGSPWDTQIENFEKLKNSTLEQLQGRVIKSELVHFDLQQKLENEILKLREIDTVDKLEKQYAQVLTMLEKLAQKHNSDFQEDCKIISKCKDAVNKDVVNLQNKIDKFLQTNQAKSESSKASMESYEGVECLCHLNLEDLTMHYITLIGNQTEAADEWKRKFLESIANNLPDFAQDIMDEVDNWEENLTLKSSNNLEENLRSVEESRENIQENFYKVRLNELLNHKQHLDRHIKMIQGLISESSKCLPSLVNYSDIVDEYKVDALRMIEEYGTGVNNSGQIKCLQNMLKSMKNKHIDKIDLRTRNSLERLFKKISMMKKLNEDFLSEIILFRDGGNYCIEELNLIKKEFAALTKQIQKDESDNKSKIKKLSDTAKSQINSTEKSHFESLNNTMQKLKMIEDISNSLAKCEYFISQKMKRLTDTNSEMMDKVSDFIEQCRNKGSAAEMISIVDQLIKNVEKTFHFVKGPYPDIEIPNELRKEQFAGTKSTSAKGKGAPRPSKEEKKVEIDAEIQYDQYNFVSMITKFIQDTLSLIKDRAKTYYTLLINKKEFPFFPDKNPMCEECINVGLQQLNLFYINAFNFWIDETSEFLKFFEAVDLPAIHMCLIDECEEEESFITISSVEKDSNTLTSKKIDDNFTKFESELQEMLHLLQSKFAYPCGQAPQDEATLDQAALDFSQGTIDQSTVGQTTGAGQAALGQSAVGQTTGAGQAALGQSAVGQTTGAGQAALGQSAVGQTTGAGQAALGQSAVGQNTGAGQATLGQSAVGQTIDGQATRKQTTERDGNKNVK